MACLQIKSLFCKPSVSEEDAAPLYDALASDSRKGLLNEEVLDALSVATTAQQKAETGTSLHPSSLSTAADVSQRLMGNRGKNDAQDMLGCENKPDGKKGIGPFKGPIAQFVKGIKAFVIL
ncbi:hypothetical protein CEUSTIGMA_g8758.t1 [Chlamydomonas eustigma]|uniref:Uncharacterized protein n=1 Tax=Chlamydomonas eustigma TaxID=1157962 RepID=A0A250XE16_9CHLO|nr:hypothetical protein CEUSTIGMA_g8758.t1 [Chlamydomonas eustigma]|eukprot:GAX81327.1 hypothetical protein CEUSTIGMA_g8758.t1 [Chlamydomonas eustigma]